MSTSSADTAMPASVPVSGTLSLSAARAQFPALENKVYLDAASIGLCSLRTAEAVADFTRQSLSCTAPSGTDLHGSFTAQRENARETVARLINASRSDIAFMESATHALAVVARALPLRPGDRVLIPDTEFLQMGVVWSHLRQAGISTDLVHHQEGRLSVDAIRARMTKQTRVVAISSVQWTHGYRVDLAALAELCRQRGVWLIADAAQHVGVLPLDVQETPVDALVVSGHKWLNSPFGAGFLYLAPRLRPRLRPALRGFMAATPPRATWGETFQHPDVTPLMDCHFTNDARSWETGGTSNWIGAIALAASIGIQLEVGPSTVAAHALALTGQLIEELDGTPLRVVTPRNPERRAAIATFTTGSATGDTALMRHLLAQKIAVSVRFTSGVGGVRVSCHYFNSTHDIERLAREVRKWRPGSA
ncbi:aminotransferase class V-fold PLP-dependent enzyme [Streptomyces microflavus]|uniref:aminotransferase class V-fold PLP-dependent enzyme n=1 Tax=Streptomyces microflavus TaxID=1919 RepID=UPI00365CAE07